MDMLRGALTVLALSVAASCGGSESSSTNESDPSGSGGSSGGTSSMGGQSTESGGNSPGAGGLVQGEENSALANVLTGVAPLAVHLDASALVFDDFDRPFHELTFRWNFGDPASGTFEPSGRSRNEAEGGISGHVFEQPGTYSVQLLIEDPQGQMVGAQHVEVHVEDPDVVFAGTSTVCISSMGNFNGCPSDATQVQASDPIVLNDHIATSRRILFRRGETFSGSSFRLNTAGPVIVGAFGPEEDAKPMLQFSDGNGILLSRGNSPDLSDLRLMDLQLVGAGSGVGLLAEAFFERTLFLRLTVDQFSSAFKAPVSVLAALAGNASTSAGNDRYYSDLAFFDCDFRHASGGSGGYLLFLAGTRLTIMGNHLQDASLGEHVIRLTYADRAVISDNFLAEPNAAKHCLKLHAVCRTNEFDEPCATPMDPDSTTNSTEPDFDPTRDSRFIVISHNEMVGNGAYWISQIEPQADQYDERIFDVVVEGNTFHHDADTQVGLHVSSGTNRVTIRNNSFLGGFGAAIQVEDGGIGPAPVDVVQTDNTVE